MSRGPGLLLLLAVACIPANGVADNQSPFMASIAIERAPGATGPLPESLATTLHVNDPQRTLQSLAHVDGLDVVATANGTVRVTLVNRPTVAGLVDAKYTASSWVVDYEEASVRVLLEQLEQQHETVPSVEHLEEFVFEHIADKSYSRSFDLASRVAASGEGDCTEHAVLLAALARAYGLHARVVLGSLILDLDEGLFAFGHAWTEIHDGQRWQIRDATMPGSGLQPRQLRYIPIAPLADEGPGYFLSLVDVMSAMPLRITDVGPAR